MTIESRLAKLEGHFRYDFSDLTDEELHRIVEICQTYGENELPDDLAAEYEGLCTKFKVIQI